MLLQQSSAKSLNTNPICYQSAFMLQFLRCLLWQFEVFMLVNYPPFLPLSNNRYNNNLLDKTIWIELQNIFFYYNFPYLLLTVSPAAVKISAFVTELENNNH